MNEKVIFIPGFLDTEVFSLVQKKYPNVVPYYWEACDCKSKLWESLNSTPPLKHEPQSDNVVKEWIDLKDRCESQIKEFVKQFKQKSKEELENTIFIGHFWGAEIVLRVLSQLKGENKDLKVKKVILVGATISQESSHIKRVSEAAPIENVVNKNVFALENLNKKLGADIPIGLQELEQNNLVNIVIDDKSTRNFLFESYWQKDSFWRKILKMFKRLFCKKK